MSRIGKQPIQVLAGVTVTFDGNTATVKGPKGELTQTFRDNISFVQEDNTIIVDKKDETQESRSLHGLSRTLLDNMIIGVSKGFEKQLEIIGVGYRAQANKNKITLSLGFSHPIEYVADPQIEIIQDEKNKNLITVKGISKQVVGETAAKIRSYKKPEPYKGKGIRYLGEYVARKTGKSAGA